MNIKTFYKLAIMVRKVIGGLWMAACLLTLGIMVAPCLLVFSVGNDGELTPWNLVGLAWMAVLFGIFKWKSR